jgi:signal transduction histidine kinase
METIVLEVVDEISSANPGRQFRLDALGPQEGEWDAARISQAVANLVGNAIEHGAEGGEVMVAVGGSEDEVTVSVHNLGKAIPASQLRGIFDPMKRRESTAASANGPTGNLGLGLYIADRIVSAHKGRIEVESSDEDGTTFAIHLPRR